MTNMAWTLFKFNEKLTSYVDKAETTLNSLYNYLNELLASQVRHGEGAGCD